VGILMIPEDPSNPFCDSVVGVFCDSISTSTKEKNSSDVETWLYFCCTEAHWRNPGQPALTFAVHNPARGAWLL